MSALAPIDRFRLALHRFSRLGRAGIGTLAAPLTRWRAARGSGSQLLIAPPDLRTTDPTIANDIYAGRFAFAGQSVETEGRSPFDTEPPSDDWLRALHEFGWLRHLRAADTELARSNAQAIVADWLTAYGRSGEPAWEPAVAARRTMAFLSQSPLILSNADLTLYRAYVRALLRHAAFLRTRFATIEAGVPRLRAATAIAMVGLSLSRQDRLIRAGMERVESELAAQVLSDGGHITRNPAAIVEILLDLLPLRQTLIARNQSPSDLMLRAIDRMIPMLRFFRHADGTIANFNGVASSANDITATVLAYDETLGSPVSSARYSGYERITAGPALLIADAGAPPPLAYSADAHAGALSFEMSVAGQGIISNCGAPAKRHADLRHAARLTAAHSTAVIGNQSSCQFSSPQPDIRIVSGPRALTSRRREEEDGSQRLEMSHDGYQRLFGYIHERTLVLSATGDRLTGRDRFSGQGNGSEPDFAVRFHLHYTVHAEPGADGAGIDLHLPDGSLWRFESSRAVDLEPSIFLSDVFGSQRTQQIVISGTCRDQMSVDWRLFRAR
jgi:uncharacterized heparinase superfamily protein